MEVYCPPPLKTGGEGTFLIQSHNFSRQLPRLEVSQLFRATRGLFHSPEDEQGPAFIQNRPLVMQEIWQYGRANAHLVQINTASKKHRTAAKDLVLCVNDFLSQHYPDLLLVSDKGSIFNQKSKS